MEVLKSILFVFVLASSIYITPVTKKKHEWRNSISLKFSLRTYDVKHMQTLVLETIISYITGLEKFSWKIFRRL